MQPGDDYCRLILVAEMISHTLKHKIFENLTHIGLHGGPKNVILIILLQFLQTLTNFYK